MAKVVWDDQAVADLRQIIRYINQFDPVAAVGIGSRLFDLGESLDQFPHRGRPTGDGLREMVTVPPYVLRYDVRGDTVIVLSIHHGARRV